MTATVAKKKHEAVVLMDKSTSFKTKLENFLSSISAPEAVKNQVRREMVKLILTIQQEMGANFLTRISREHDFFEDFKFFKNMYLDKSAYLHRTLWREIVYFIQEQEYKTKDSKKEVENQIKIETNIFNPEIKSAKLKELENKLDSIKVLELDILYAINFLQDDDIEKIINMKINHELNVSLDLQNTEFTTGKTTKRDLNSYTKSKTNTLKYLSRYDPGMSKEDFQQDIAEELLRVNNIYNKSSGKNLAGDDDVDTAIKKYIETSLNNKVNQIKDYWGSGIRNRVSSTHSALYNRKENLEKQIKTEEDPIKLKKLEFQLKAVEIEIKEGKSDYFSVLVPLVRTNESENREVDAQEVDPTIIIDDINEEKIWAKDLIDDLPPRLSKCVNILMGNYDEGFVAWTRNTSSKKYNLDILDHMFKAAMEYCRVTRNELRNNATIIQALHSAPATQKFFNQKDSDILVQNLTTKKVYTAKIEDTRSDGSLIFSVISGKDSKVIDTSFDKKWKLVNMGA